MLAIFIMPFMILFNYFLYRVFMKWLNLFNDKFNNFVLKYGLFIFQLFFSICLVIGFFLPSGKIRRTFLLLGNYWLGFIIYSIFIFIILFVIKKILSVFVDKKYNDRIYKILGLSFIILVFGTVIYGSISVRDIKTKRYYVNINKDIDIDKLNIVMVADLHIGYNIGNKHIENMVKKINKEKPDIVLISGDIFDNEYKALENPGKLVKILKSIKSKYGTYAVYGNHDVEERVLMGFTFDSKESKQSSIKMDKLLKDANVKLMRDEYELIDDSFYLYGRPDFSRLGRGIKKRNNAKEITKDMDKSKAIIVMDHQPFEMDKLSRAGVDLDLSGHTHNGQIFPLNFVMKLKFDNSYGIKKYNNMYNVVTSGVGVFGPNLRVFINSEITTIRVNFK